MNKVDIVVAVADLVEGFHSLTFVFTCFARARGKSAFQRLGLDKSVADVLAIMPEQLENLYSKEARLG